MTAKGQARIALESAVIGVLLPSERGRWARPAGDNRRFLNGMLHVLRVGCPWRDMHKRYGKWNSVDVRFRRWAQQGVWDALLQTLVDLGLTAVRRPFYRSRASSISPLHAYG